MNKLPVSIQQDIERCLALCKHQPKNIDAVEATARLVARIEQWHETAHNARLSAALREQREYYQQHPLMIFN